jgi:hypothetical protein
VIVFASSRTAASYVRSSSRIVVVVARVVVVRFVSFRFDAFVAAARANSTPSSARIIFISRFAASAIAARARARASRDRARGGRSRRPRRFI